MSTYNNTLHGIGHVPNSNKGDETKSLSFLAADRVFYYTNILVHDWKAWLTIITACALRSYVCKTGIGRLNFYVSYTCLYARLLIHKKSATPGKILELHLHHPQIALIWLVPNSSLFAWQAKTHKKL